MSEGQVAIKTRREYEKKILATVDQLLGRRSWFDYDWKIYKNHDKIIITIGLLDAVPETLYDKLKELNLDFKMKFYKPFFAINNEVISYFKNKNKHLSKRILYLNNAWRLGGIFRYKGVFIVNDENKHLLKYIHLFGQVRVRIEINFY